MDGKPGRPSVEVAPDSVADRLRQVQARSNIATDKEFADVAGVSRSTMSAYLNGHQVPKFQTLHRIAQATGTDFEWLKAGYPNAHLRDIRPSPSLETVRIPLSYGSLLGEVEPVALSEIQSAVNRLADWRARHLSPHDKVKLAIRAHDFIVKLLEGDSNHGRQSTDTGADG